MPAQLNAPTTDRRAPRRATTLDSVKRTFCCEAGPAGLDDQVRDALHDAGAVETVWDGDVFLVTFKDDPRTDAEMIAAIDAVVAAVLDHAAPEAE